MKMVESVMRSEQLAKIMMGKGASMLKSFPSFSPPPLSLMYYNVLQSLESEREGARCKQRRRTATWP